MHLRCSQTLQIMLKISNLNLEVKTIFLIRRLVNLFLEVYIIISNNNFLQVHLCQTCSNAYLLHLQMQTIDF